MPRHDFTPAAAPAIRGRFDSSRLKVRTDSLLDDMRTHAHQAGPQFYPMMTRHRRGLLDDAVDKAKHLLRQADPAKLSPLLCFTIDAERPIGFDTDLVIPAGTMLRDASGALMRPDTTFALPAQAMQLWQLGRLVPGLRYDGVVETDELEELLPATMMRVMLGKHANAGPEVPYELAAVMPTNTTDTGLVPDLENIVANGGNAPVREPGLVGTPGVVRLLDRLMLLEYMDKLNNVRHRFAGASARNPSGLVPVLPIIQRFPGLNITRHKHPPKLVQALRGGLSHS